MKAKGKFALWVSVLFGAGIAAPVATGFAVVAALAPPDREVVLRVLEQRMPLLAVGALGLLALSAAVVRWFFATYVESAVALADLTRSARRAQGPVPITAEGAAELVQVAGEIERLAAEMHRLRAESGARVRDALAHLEEERNRLAALMSELVEGVLVCNAEGRILLYNEQARALLSSRDSAPAPVGLGRSIFSLMDRDQVAHAIEKLEQARDRGEAAPRTRFVAPAASSRGSCSRWAMSPACSNENRSAFPCCNRSPRARARRLPISVRRPRTSPATLTWRPGGCGSSSASSPTSRRRCRTRSSARCRPTERPSRRA